MFYYRQLTYALLKDQFEINLEIPDGYLIPTVTSRYKYILWVHELLLQVAEYFDAKKSIIGLDVGTGASCIYPLLGSKLFGWHFRASDRCAKLALKNVTANKLENRISLVLVDEDDPPLLKLVDQANRYHFCVCNPPFFNSKEEQESTHLRQTKPLSDNPGKEHEAVTRGGELEFIEKLLQDSLTLKKTIIWYTSLVGKKRSFLSIVKRLKGLRE